MAERRWASVLFADLVGFTTLSESRDPEQVRELLSGYFERCREIVATYDGVVEKFIGDAVMAVWGVPAAHEDDAERAVRAGAALTEMVAALGLELSAPLALRVGVVTGEVATTVGATAEGMVAGDAVNTAARVQSAARPGTVWVDALTRELTTPDAEYADTGLHELKGKAESMRLFELVSMSRFETRSEGIRAHLTGRDDELNLLRDLFRSCVHAQRPRLVVVEGEAGVGKSRLAAEFQAWVEGLDEVVKWHRGRCLSYGSGVAFWALAEAVRTRLGLLEADSGAVVDERLDDLLVEICREPGERDHLRPRVASLIGASFDGSFTAEDLFTAWSRFFELVGAGDPLVLVLDDAHHADDGLRDFVEHLVSRSRMPVLVLALARPELLDAHPGWGGRSLATVPLTTLGPDAMSQLIDGLIQGLGSEDRDALVARAGGVPLFAVETVRALLDQGLLREEGDELVADPDRRLQLDAGGAPATLRSLVLSRLDRLPALERRLVGYASVLGLTFTRAGLEAVHGAPVLPELVDSLLDKEVLAIEEDRFSGERGSLRFVHDVVRQVAYSTLSRRDRKARHVRAADFLQGENQGELDAIVAQHLLDALEAAFDGDADASDLASRAVVSLERGAARAQALGAPEQAEDLLLRAADVAVEAGDRARMLVLAARVTVASGHPGRGADYADEAIGIYGALDRPRLAAEAASARAYCLVWDGRFEDAILVCEQGLAWIADKDDSSVTLTRVRLLNAGRMAAGNLDRGEEAEWFNDRELELSEAVDDPELRVQGWIGRGMVLVRNRSDLIGSTRAMARAIELGRELGGGSQLALALMNQCGNLELEDRHEARRLLDESLDLSRRFGYRNVLDGAAAGVTEFAYIEGDLDTVEEMSREMLDLGPTLNVLYAYVYAEARAAYLRGLPPPDRTITAVGDGNSAKENRAWAQFVAELDAGNLHSAVTTAELAADYGVADAGVWGAAMSLPFVITCLLDVGEVDAAVRLVARLDDLNGSSSLIGERAITSWLRSAVGLAAERGLTGDYEAGLRQAIVDLGTWGAPLYRAWAVEALGRGLLEAGRSDEADQLLDEATAFYREHGIDRWLHRLDDWRSSRRAT